MPTGNKIAIMGFGRIGRTLPFIFTEHLHLCDKKLHIVRIPEKSNIIPEIIQQHSFEISPDLRIIDYKNFRSLVNIYKSVQRKYYPEKDIFQTTKNGEVL